MIKWKKSKAIYVSGITGYLGKWQIFYLFWDGIVSKDDDRNYGLRCYLPGIKSHLGHFKEEEKGKEKAIKTLSYWLKHAGLNNLLTSQ